MKIGIIVHSHTGNTLGVAEKLMDTLTSAGNTVAIERVTAVNEDPSAAGNIQLKTIPDITSYDHLIFAAPVRAFSLSPVMKLYLKQLSSLKDKKVSCFVTQHFAFPWMGGNNAIKQVKRACESKGASISNTGIVNWSNKSREKMISNVIEKLCEI